MESLRMIIFNTVEFSLLKEELLQKIYSHLSHNYILGNSEYSEYNFADTQLDRTICSRLFDCNLVILLIDSTLDELYKSQDWKELSTILSSYKCVIYPIHLNKNIIEEEEIDRIANDIYGILTWLPEYSARYFMLDYEAIINKIHDLIKEMRFTTHSSSKNKKTIETKITIKINLGVFNIKYSRKETTDIKE